MDDILKLASFIGISSYRRKTMMALQENGVLIPTQIAGKTGIRTNHISKVLFDLKEKGLVECINEEARKGRLYRLTETGERAVEALNLIE